MGSIALLGIAFARLKARNIFDIRKEKSEDILFIGQTHDPFQVAALMLASQVFVFYSALGTVFGIGSTSMISRVLGAGDNRYAKKVCSFCMWGSVGTGCVFSIVMCLFMGQLLRILGADSQTWDFTKDYLSIVAFAGPFAVINGCYSNILRAEGESTKAMMGQLIGNLTNIVLDPVMIVGLGMNTKGAALATVIGNLVGTIYYVWYFYRKKSMLSISIRDFTVKDGVCTRVLAIGIPASLNVLFMAISHIILNKLMAGYGNLQLAGVGVAINLLKIPGTICIGFGQGIQPLIGYCYGSGNWVRCKKVIRFSLISGFILSCILCLMCISEFFLKISPEIWDKKFKMHTQNECSAVCKPCFHSKKLRFFLFTGMRPIIRRQRTDACE